MALSRGYLVFGILVLALAGVAEWRGWRLAGTAEARTDPRSVRNNPGSYRSTYYGGRVHYGK
ncbi:MAG: hypothetical protein HYX65_02005 [Gemmatimonadetes bacterium]|nr:hypothetical protein [Gemmatimonadota bacterium]